MKVKDKSNKIIIINILLILISISILVLNLYVIFSPIDYFDKRTYPAIENTIVFLLIILIIILSFSIVLSVKEYKNRMIHKNIISTGSSRLTLTEIFENENRKRIIKAILQNPGIHHNELLRECDIQKGQLQWHLDVLLKNDIVKKEKYRQYSVYFPIINNINTFELFENGLAKSETTNKIFELIQENPGIYSSEIARKINLARNTVKYHIDKLIKEKLIEKKKKGRKIALYSSN